MTRPRHNSQRDANQGDIVQGLRDCGYYVEDVSAFIGWADLAVYGPDRETQTHRWRFFEVKTRTGKLTPKERKFQWMYSEAVQTVRTLEAALSYFGR